MWAAAKQGEGGTVLITGEPGIGKSRLAHEVRLLVGRDNLVTLDCRCLPEHQNNALYPILDLLKRRLRLQETPSTTTAVERLQAALASSNWPIETSLPVLCSWLALPIPENVPLIQHSPDQQKQILLEVLEQMLFHWGSQQPFALIVEDLHWMDPTGMQWLERLIQAAVDSSLLLVLTARSEFSSPWQEGMFQMLSLQRLAGEQTKIMIQQVLGDEAVDDAALSRLVERVDGIPLFVEELVRMLLERGLLAQQNDAYVLSEQIDEVSIPITLRDMLNERLANLGPAKETAQIAAAVGREFDYDLLVRVSFKDERLVQADLDQLIDTDLAYRQRVVQAVS